MKLKSKYHFILLQNRPRPILSPVFLVVVVLIILIVNPKPVEALSIIDDTNQLIKLQRPAQRIIALYGGYNEIVAALGIEGRLIARTKADRIPESIINKPVLGTHMRPNIELTMSLKPDLILQNAGRREAMIPVDQLKKLGFQVAVFSPETFDELFSVIERIGILTGTSDRAKLLVQTMGLRLKNVQDKVSKISQKPEVFFEARYPNLLAAGQSSIVNDIIRYAGGNNCVSVQKKFVRVNEESLLSWDPDFYLIQIGPMNRNPVKLKDRAHYKKLRVVSEKKYLEVDEQIFSRPGPRSIEAVEKLSQFIFPHLWGMN